MKVTLIAFVIVFGLGSFFPARSVRAADHASEALAAYVTADEGNDPLKRQAEAFLEEVQVVTLRYERDGPSPLLQADTAFALSLKCSHVVPISEKKNGKDYLAIVAVFSRFFGRAKDMNADAWLREMKRPITAGFRLKSIDAVVMPSPDVVKQSLERSQAAVNRVASELKRIQGEFKQLESLERARRDRGALGEDGRPRYPRFAYTHDVGPVRKEGRERLSDDWCALRFGIGPITGNPRQRPSPTRAFPRQGISAEWQIESGSSRLNAKFEEIVAESLRELEALEVELKTPSK